jgi:prolyl-tRNA editing enzyme YbaK/EbsC (Cys-tRNA(Pro) deacylase)
MIAMAIDKVKEYFQRWGREKDILEFDTSSATVEMASNALGVKPCRIAKTLSLKAEDSAILIVTAGDAKIDNSKFKAEFHMKAKFLTPEEVVMYTGHAIGGVCPFAIEQELKVYLDVSLRRFQTVFPACGSSNSAIELTCDELEEYAGCSKWVDVCKDWEETIV